VRARLAAWKGRPLAALGKAKAANVFFYLSLWYRTEVVDPRRGSRGTGGGGYEALEREVVVSWSIGDRQGKTEGPVHQRGYLVGRCEG
jgi:hypothetical protein